MIGEFMNGRSELYDQEPFNGRMILVRFVFRLYPRIPGDRNKRSRMMGAKRGK